MGTVVYDMVVAGSQSFVSLSAYYTGSLPPSSCNGAVCTVPQFGFTCAKIPGPHSVTHFFLYKDAYEALTQTELFLGT